MNFNDGQTEWMNEGERNGGILFNWWKQRPASETCKGEIHVDYYYCNIGEASRHF